MVRCKGTARNPLPLLAWLNSDYELKRAHDSALRRFTLGLIFPKLYRPVSDPLPSPIAAPLALHDSARKVFVARSPLHGVGLFVTAAEVGQAFELPCGELELIWRLELEEPEPENIPCACYPGFAHRINGGAELINHSRDRPTGFFTSVCLVSTNCRLFWTSGVRSSRPFEATIRYGRSYLPADRHFLPG